MKEQGYKQKITLRDEGLFLHHVFNNIKYFDMVDKDFFLNFQELKSSFGCFYLVKRKKLCMKSAHPTQLLAQCKEFQPLKIHHSSIFRVTLLSKRTDFKNFYIINQYIKQ